MVSKIVLLRSNSPKFGMLMNREGNHLFVLGKPYVCDDFLRSGIKSNWEVAIESLTRNH